MYKKIIDTMTGITGSGTNLLFSNSTGWMLLDAEL